MNFCLVFFLWMNLIISKAHCQGFGIDQKIKQVFNRAGFETIVTPEPINLQPTQSPQILQNNGQSCKCVPYFQCENPPRVDTTENRIYGQIDVRYNPESCQDVLDVCCQSSGGNGGGSIPPVNEIKATPPPITNPNAPLPPTIATRCGVRNVNGIDFTLIGNNNNEAGFAEFPWMVALLLSDRECLCGGSLIHPKVVLTGAHCVFNISQHVLRIRAGEWDTQTEKERLRHQERNVASIITHPDFNTRTLANDVVRELLY
jgi:plasma kallikrein